MRREGRRTRAADWLRILPFLTARLPSQLTNGVPGLAGSLPHISLLTSRVAVKVAANVQRTCVELNCHEEKFTYSVHSSSPSNSFAEERQFNNVSKQASRGHYILTVLLRQATSIRVFLVP
jgi:hypothetical protein